MEQALGSDLCFLAPGRALWSSAFGLSRRVSTGLDSSDGSLLVHWASKGLELRGGRLLSVLFDMSLFSQLMTQYTPSGAT